MTTPTHRTSNSDNLHTPELIPIGDSPPQSPLPVYQPKTYMPDYLEPEDIKNTIDLWQQQIYLDFMRRKEIEAKTKMLAKVKNNG